MAGCNGHCLWVCWFSNTGDVSQKNNILATTKKIEQNPTEVVASYFSFLLVDRYIQPGSCGFNQIAARSIDLYKPLTHQVRMYKHQGPKHVYTKYL